MPGERLNSPQLVAFYLPQFHPIAENDAAWGKGFTEWTHVARARPLFPGHYQPHIPADLGFYDLRLAETRLAQAALACRHGISAFCYYHYWMGGRRLLERPFNEVLDSGEPDFPFCLCWANESWTGVWYGKPSALIVEQTYPGPDDHLRHMDWLAKAFHDGRYLKVDGKPLFMVFKPLSIPDLPNTLNLWRERAEKNGLPGLHLVAVRHYNGTWNPVAAGFDASVTIRMPPIPAGLDRAIDRTAPWMVLHEAVKDFLIEPGHPGQLDYPCVGPNWDNTPRCGTRGIVLHESRPEHFVHSLHQARRRLEQLPAEHQLCFIKSWNEWAEGNHLEPDQRFGTAWLEAIRSVFPTADHRE
jgi:lipopolysaccharide biosynthesis protein